MSTCDGRFEPKPSAPRNWVLTPENLYNGRLLEIFAGVYAAKELADQTTPGSQNQEWTSRKNQWIDFLNRLKNPPNQNTKIIDLGLVPDLCIQGRPIEPAIPSLTPEALANGSVGNAVAELYKQQLFDQWCQCRPRDRERETCECQKYVINITIQLKRPVAQGPNTFNQFRSGKLSSLTTRPGVNPGMVSIGYLSNIGCLDGGDGSPQWNSLVEGIPSEVDRYDVLINSVTLQPGFPVIDCNPTPPEPDPPPYVPGLPPGFDIALPPSLPNNPPEDWPPPRWFIPVNSPFGTPIFPIECPPVDECEYMFWDIESNAKTELYSDIPPSSGVVVFGTADTVDFDVKFDIESAIADRTLRSWRRLTEPLNDDTTFINVAIVYLMVDGVSVGDGEEMNVPNLRIRVPFEYRDRQKSIKIMPKGVNTAITINDSGNRWKSKKFPTT